VRLGDELPRRRSRRGTTLPHWGPYSPPRAGVVREPWPPGRGKNRNEPQWRPQLQAGKLKLIAVTNSARAPTLPDLPTAKDLTFDGLVGFFGWAGMPTELRDSIAADIREAAADSDAVPEGC
jgi:hypothetical protein